MAVLARVGGSGLLDGVVFVRGSSRARRVLLFLARYGRASTKQLLRVAGVINDRNHWLLRRLEALGLIRRYSGRNEQNIPVVWNEITELGRRVLEIVEEMGEG